MEESLHDPFGTVAIRVLGALVEKEFTTPDNYPLSLNSLVAACNQSSNREPVMQLGESEVVAGLQELAGRSLAREVHRSDSRVKRYRHLLQETWQLHAPEMALLGVLLLRGPQTVGELRTRTARMVEFIDLSHVEITLSGMATLSHPLVTQLPRQPGQKEARYAHLLAGEPQHLPDAPAIAPAPATGPDLLERVDSLEQQLAAALAELAELRTQFDAFRQEFS